MAKTDLHIWQKETCTYGKKRPTYMAQKNPTYIAKETCNRARLVQDGNQQRRRLHSFFFFAQSHTVAQHATRHSESQRPSIFTTQSPCREDGFRTCACTVLPSPMQSPKMPPAFARYFLYSHSTPARW